MPPAEEERAFQEIVAGFKAHRRAKWSLAVGIAFILVAAGLFLFAGYRGAIIAIFPWLIGMFLVVRSRAWR